MSAGGIVWVLFWMTRGPSRYNAQSDLVEKSTRMRELDPVTETGPIVMKWKEDTC